jgi:16S rRNA (uracil1498-N3)-methyltransferase
VFHSRLTSFSSLFYQLAQSKLAFLASAEAPPVLSVLPKSSNEESGLLIIGPEGGKT